MGELRTRTLFRDVNARIRGISERFGRETRSFLILCECGADGCRERLEIPPGVLAQVQDDADPRYLVAPGHERPAMDDLVLEAEGYSIVAVDAFGSEHARAGLTPSAAGAGIR